MNKPLTLDEFAKKSAIPSKLVHAVVKQNGGWEDFQTYAEMIASGGADAGWNGFIYYSDTIAFTKANRAAILVLARDQAQECGVSVRDFITGFNCLNQDEETSNAVGRFVFGGRYLDNDKNDSNAVWNALAWYALEEVARSLVSIREQEE